MEGVPRENLRKRAKNPTSIFWTVLSGKGKGAVGSMQVETPIAHAGWEQAKDDPPTSRKPSDPHNAIFTLSYL